MSVNDFINELQKLQPELREKEITISIDGVMFDPIIKIELIKPTVFLGPNNVGKIIITK